MANSKPPVLSSKFYVNSQTPTPALLTRETVRCYVAMGANLGDPIKAFEVALSALDSIPGILVRACSKLYLTEPFEATGPAYINAVCALETKLTAPHLLTTLQCLELEAGRVREFHHQPRTLDLDLLFFGQAHIQSPDLWVPHPRWFERAFVLKPLMELEPSWVSQDMLARVQNQGITLLEPQTELWPEQ